MKGQKQERRLKAGAKGTQSALKESSEIAITGKQKGMCTKGDSCSFRHDESKRGKFTRSSSPTPKSPTNNDGKNSSKGKPSLRQIGQLRPYGSCFIASFQQVRLAAGAAENLRGQDLPEWLQNFTEHVVGEKCSSSGSERIYLPEQHRPGGSNGKHNVLRHHSKDPVVSSGDGPKSPELRADVALNTPYPAQKSLVTW